ncbi:MAG: ABC transporter permease subunit [Planctomycetota bacterium]
MSGVATIWRRELAGLFLSPLAWILFCLTLFYNAFFFLNYLQYVTGGDVNASLALVCGGAWPFWYLLMVLAPLLTMRMISEEARSGLLEFLLTAPVGDAAVVVGKALAATTVLALVWACGPFYALCVHLAGTTPDWGIVLTTWLGSVLVSALFCAVGLVASAASATPLVAAFLAFLADVTLLVSPLLGRTAGGALRRPLRAISERVDVVAHFQDSFLTGALDSAHIVFFVAWTAALLFVAVRLVESRRWR